MRLSPAIRFALLFRRAAAFSTRSGDAPPSRGEPVDATATTYQGDDTRAFVSAAGLLLGTLGYLLGEFLLARWFALANVPSSHFQRLLIASNLSAWAGAVAAAIWFLYIAAFKLPSRRRPDRRWTGLILFPLVACVVSVLSGSAAWFALALFALLTAFSRIILQSDAPASALGAWTLLYALRLWIDMPSFATAFAIVGWLAAFAFAFLPARLRERRRLIWAPAAVVLLAFELARPPESWPALALGAVAFWLAAAAPAAVCGWMTAAAALLAWTSLNCQWDCAAPMASGAVLALFFHASHVGPAVVRRLTCVPWASAVIAIAGVLIVGAAPAFVVVTLGVGLGLGLHKKEIRGRGPHVVPPRGFLVIGFAVAAMLVRILFWTSTDRIWEDGLITLRHAENAARGFGLTHHPAHGRVHGFTSPLNVLIPLLGEWVVRGGGLFALRATGVFLGGLTIYFAGCLANNSRIGLTTPALIFWLTYLAFDHSQIAFGIAGMETQIWICVLLGGAAALLEDRRSLLALSLTLAGLSRPEGFFWIALALAAVGVERGARPALRLGAAVAIGLLPWMTFATLYYGSPLPHTIVAKARGYLCGGNLVGPLHSSFLGYAAEEFREGLQSKLLPVISPCFLGDGGRMIPTSPAPATVGRLLLLLGAVGSIVSFHRRTWIVPAYVAGVTVYLLLLVRIIFAWYPTPTLALAGLLVGVGLDACCQCLPARTAPVFRWTGAAALSALFVAPLPATFRTETGIQQVIEYGVRRQVGVWLREHAKPGDYVCSESLGYIGYFSNLPIHDYPGLSSPRATAALAERGVDQFLQPIIDELRPEWVVLRERELRQLAGYRKVHSVSAPADDIVKLTRFLPVASIDYSFHIFHRE